VDDKNEIREALEKTVDFYEASKPTPWKANFDDKFIDGLMNGMVTFTFLREGRQYIRLKKSS
jgi:transcriptional regulator